MLVPVLGSKYAGTEPVIMMMAALALMQALETGMGRVLFAADLQVPRAVAILLGATSALILCLILIPKMAVPGAILAGVLSFLIINFIYFVALRRPMRGAGLVQALLIPLAGLTLGIVAVWQCASHGLPFWVQAFVSAAALRAGDRQRVLEHAREAAVGRPSPRDSDNTARDP